MIQLLNPTRLTRTPFFQELIPYLESHPGVILREIKREFAHYPVDKLLENLIKEGLVLREEKRYYLTLPFLEDLAQLELDQEVFVREESAVFQELQKRTFQTELHNQTNAAVLREETDFARTDLTLSNYFYRVKQGYLLTEKQAELYAVLGDINPEYALKYMTTFLLKFLKKDVLMQKRRDIFVDSLVLLGYIRQNQEGKYELAVDFDKEALRFFKPRRM